MRRSGWLLIAVLCASARSRGSNADDGYIDSAICATCHARQAETYQRTGMAKSFYKPAPAEATGTYYHKPSDTYYAMTARDGKLYQSQYQIGFDGKQTNPVEKVVDYVVGSGNHTKTYLSRTPRDTLIELPLAWYAEKGGYWAMNPGYDRPDQEGFRRHIEYNCMFCHNAYPETTSLRTSSGEAVFPAALPQGIDCQRCHGPGRAHVESARNSIVNPAKLPVARRVEVCQQCHLETTSFPLPNSLTRYERAPFSYRPGEPLADFRLQFDHAPGTGHEDDFEIASSAYQLNKSACVLKSGDKLTCTTCHDPHDVQHGAVAQQHYNAVCQTCHSVGEHVSSGDCVTCHMPKRRTDDVVHVTMTDHHIQKIRPTRDLLADIAERRDSYRGEVIPYGPSEEVYLATAQVVQGSNLQAGIPRLAAAIRRLQPAGPDHYVALADALRSAGQCRQAIPVYEEALRRGPGAVTVIQKMALCLASTGQYEKAAALLKPAPDDAKMWTQLGLALVGAGKSAEGIAALEKATAADPDLSEAWNDLGGVWLQSGDAVRAEPALRRAILVQPNYAEAHNNLANLLSAANRFDEAKFHFEAALRYKPEYAFARYSYGLALGRAGRFSDARSQLETSLKEETTSDTHQALGMVFAAQGDSPHAIEHYREAVRLRPTFARANLSLGAALAEAGKTAEARPFLRTASESNEVAVRDEARRLLEKIP